MSEEGRQEPPTGQRPEEGAPRTAGTPPGYRHVRRRFRLTYVVPVVVLLALAVLPLMAGSETLILRDILNSHLPMKASQARALTAGYMPLLDPYRAGGQPLAGNPNAVPFYPTNLLYLVASPLWALNAHFWLHLLLAPFAAFWMGRTWGLSRQAAWAVGVSWALSGYFLSQLAFYNLVAGVALAPALVAACLVTVGRGARRRPWAVPAVGVLWALMLLAGDPLMALLAGLAAATAVPVRHGLPRRGRLAGWGGLVAAVIGGTLVAAPQLVEFLRILPLSYRGHRGYTAEVGTAASFDPRQVAEWLLPLLFGRPDLAADGSFWGEAFYTGYPPYYFSLYPGLLALGLWVAAGTWRAWGGGRRRAWGWAWGAIGVGWLFALGRFNPMVEWLFDAGSGGLLRYPVKFWLPVALGTSLLCGLGFERAVLRGTRRPLVATLAGLGVVLGGLWGALVLAPDRAHGWLRRLVPSRYDSAFVEAVRLQWVESAGTSVLLLVLFGLVLTLLGHRRPRLAGAALLGLHTLGQLLLLAPVRVTDAVGPYSTPPPALAHVPPGTRVAHGEFLRLFGDEPSFTTGNYPTPHTWWLARRAFFELYPATGALWDRRYELNVSPEGLDSFLARMAKAGVQYSEDLERVRLLAAWGVDVLLLGRPLEPVAAAETRLVARIPSSGGALWIYHLRDSAPEAYLAQDLVHAPDVGAAYRLLAGPGFDAHRTAVVPGQGEPPAVEGASAGDDPARVRWISDTPEALEVAVEAPASGLLVVQRAHLPLWRAWLDGDEVPVRVANLYRMGVEIPPGEHRVRLAVDRRPLLASTVVAALGLMGLLALGVVARRRWRRELGGS